MSDGLREKIVEALQSLGDTPDKVADAFRAMGIKSTGCGGRECPLYDYLMLKIKHENLTRDDIYVGRSWVSFYSFAETGFIVLSGAHQEFIRRFDHHEMYQDLLVTS